MMLILGLVLFFGLHLLPFFPEYRTQLVERLDNDYIESEDAYKVVFIVGSVLGLMLIGIGKGGVNVSLWGTPDILRYLSLPLVWASLILVAAAYLPNRIKNYVRHPMLIGVIIFCVAHLLTNGDLGSILIFGSFTAYSVFAIVSDQKRGREAAGAPEGASEEDEDADKKPPIVDDAILVGGATLVFLILLGLHETLFTRAVFL